MIRVITLCFLMQAVAPDAAPQGEEPAVAAAPAVRPPASPFPAGVPIGDLCRVLGVRSNFVSGLGLVTGLNGTGDQSQTTRQEIANMLSRRDFNITPRDLNAKNSAIAWVQAELPPFVDSGSKLNVTVSSMGDATSILGGVLHETQLVGADGVVYALAQGPIVVGGFSAVGDGASVTKNHTTVGIVPAGAIVEETVRMRPVDDLGQVHFKLERPEFTTARRVADAVNGLHPGSARTIDAGTVTVRIPPGLDTRGAAVGFIGEIQRLRVEPETRARVVINERTGTVVAGRGVRIDPVEITQGNLFLTIQERPVASQPAPFSEGRTETLPRTEVTAEEELSEVVVVEPGMSISRIADALNTLGVSPRDMIQLLVAIDEAGALHAELVRQ